MILTAVVSAMGAEEPEPTRLAATVALNNAIEFAQHNFETENERNYLMQVKSSTSKQLPSCTLRNAMPCYRVNEEWINAAPVQLLNPTLCTTPLPHPMQPCLPHLIRLCYVAGGVPGHNMPRCAHPCRVIRVLARDCCPLLQQAGALHDPGKPNVLGSMSLYVAHLHV